MPLIFSNALKLEPTAYNIILLIAAIALLGFYVWKSRLKWFASIKTGWALGIIMGVFFGLAFLSLASVSLPNPGELSSYLSGIIIRSFTYGLATGIMISVIPFIVTWRALSGTNPGPWRKIGVTLAAVLSITVISVLYNLGTSGLKDINVEDRIQKSMIASIPTLISGNPLATPISNIFLQVSENVTFNAHRPTENLQTAKSKTVSGGIN
jgi:hypothetical protein